MGNTQFTACDLFTALDTDDDGELSLDEVRLALATMGADASGIQELISVLYLDSPAVIHLPDFCAVALSLQQGLRDEAIRTSFRSFETTIPGELSREQVGFALDCHDLHCAFRSEDIEAARDLILSRIGPHDCGTISFEQWRSTLHEAGGESAKIFPDDCGAATNLRLPWEQRDTSDNLEDKYGLRDRTRVLLQMLDWLPTDCVDGHEIACISGAQVVTGQTTCSADVDILLEQLYVQELNSSKHRAQVIDLEAASLRLKEADLAVSLATLEDEAALLSMRLAVLAEPLSTSAAAAPYDNPRPTYHEVNLHEEEDREDGTATPYKNSYNEARKTSSSLKERISVAFPRLTLEYKMQM